MLGLLSVGLAGCGAEGDGARQFTKASAPPQEIVAQIPGRPLFEKPQAPGTYVGGAGKDLDPAVAVVVQGEKAVVYLCDGRKFSDWFGGSVKDGRFALVSRKGTRIRGSVIAKSVAGTVAVAGGREVAYEALPPAQDPPPTGFFIFDDPSSKGFKARWIVARHVVRGLSETTAGTTTSAPAGQVGSPRNGVAVNTVPPNTAAAVASRIEALLDEIASLVAQLNALQAQIQALAAKIQALAAQKAATAEQKEELRIKQEELRIRQEELRKKRRRLAGLRQAK